MIKISDNKNNNDDNSISIISLDLISIIQSRCVNCLNSNACISSLTSPKKLYIKKKGEIIL